MIAQGRDVEAGCAVRGDDPYKNPGLAATLMNAATLMKTAAMGLVGPFFAPAGSEPSLM